MKLRKTIVATIMAALLLSASAAFAQPMDGADGPSAVQQKQQKQQKGMRGVPLEKREAIRKIGDDYKDPLFKLRQEIRAKHAELNAVMLQAQPDTVKAKAISRDISGLQVQEMDLLIDMHARITKETGLRLPMKPMGMGSGAMKK